MPDTAIAPCEVAVAPTRARRARDAGLFERYHRTRDQSTRDELVERFLPLAKRLARRYGEGSEYDDLVQVASFALMKAIDRYDPGRGLAFSTYAVPTILGELKRYFRDHGWTVRVPRELQELTLRVEMQREALTGELGRSPTVAELAERAGTTVEEVLDTISAGSAHHPDSLDRPLSEDGDLAIDTLAAQTDPGFAHAEDAVVVEGLLTALSEREREIIKLRFEQDLTQAEIGQRLGLSQMHVSRLIRQSLTTLQHAADLRASEVTVARDSGTRAPTFS